MNKHFLLRICQILCILAMVVGSGIGIIHFRQKTAAVSASTIHATRKIMTSHKPPDTSAQLQAALEKEIAAYSDLEVSISVIDLATGKQTDIGETAAFLAASTTKVLTATYFMHRVEQGDASPDEYIQGVQARTLIERMLQNSDNDAWAMLNDFLGRANLQKYARQIGLSSYEAGDNTITAHDQAALLAKLYQYKLLGASHTQTILPNMQHTNNDTLIPAAVPAAGQVYHKYGQLEGELHDSAIVSYGGKSFVIVIFTKTNTDSIEDLAGRTQLFHNLTDIVLKAMVDVR